MYSKRNSVFPLPNTELPENKKTESRKSKHRKTPRVHQAEKRTESRKSKDRKSKIEKGVQQVEKREQVKGKIHER